MKKRPQPARVPGGRRRIFRAQADKKRGASDNICKLLAEKYPSQFVEWLLGVKTGVKVLKTELSREPIRADAAILFEMEDEILHLEFQTTPKSETPLPLRMLDYKVGFKRLYQNKRIRQTLLVLKDTGEKVANSYADEHTVHRYDVRKMWEEDARDLLNFAGLLPLATLCRAESGAHLLAGIAAKVNAIKLREERQAVLAMSQALAGLRYDKSLIYRILKEGNMLEESVVVQAWIERGLQKGMQQGERNLVIRQLTRRFGRLSTKARKQIEALSIKQIEKLGEALLDFNAKSELDDWLNKYAKRQR